MFKNIGKTLRLTIFLIIGFAFVFFIAAKQGLFSLPPVDEAYSSFLESDTKTKNENTNKQTDFKPLTFTKQYQFKMSELDQLKRAGTSHIQLQYQNVQTDIKRPSLINVDPVGWHNYKIDGEWLMNRGHLVGYQFCKINDDQRNLVPETAYLNTGTIQGNIDASNPKSMIFYEQRLAKWLKENPSAWLDYQVTPLYDGNDLLPKQVKLNYTGLNTQGKPVTIKLGGNEKQSLNGTMEVVLDNTSPNAVLNYSTGRLEQ